ncbi:MAG TPA: fused MFS/spermidine synthase [Gammaproteobacteria bacterium]|nr:fused MFS/spermidine synthase [Gammaproteobacteria bacterium]
MRRIVALFLLFLPLAVAQAAGERILEVRKSLYRNIVVSEENGLVCMSFRLRGRENHLQSCMDKADRDRLVFDYTRLTFTGVLINPQPRRVLVAGLGGGSIPTTFRRLFPDAEIDVVEIDPAVLDVAREHFGFRPDDRMRVILLDARVYVKQALRQSMRYDYIVLDAFNGDYIPEHLMTREFLEECRELLVEGGVLVANTFSESALYHSESRTYEAAFGWFLNLRRPFGNRIIVTRKGPPVTPQALAEAVGTVRGDFERYGIDLAAAAALASDRPDWNPRARLLTDQYNPANLLKGQ